MKTNSLFLAAFVLVFSGCMKDESQLWSQFRSKSELNARTPAQALALRPRCYVDRFQEDLLLKEVNQWETKYQGGLRANFKDKELNLIDISQATIDVLNENTYLDQSLGRSWFTTLSTQKDCKDLRCLADHLYKRPTNEGLLQYWYFLKTGYAFAAFQGHPWFSNGATSTVVVPGVELERYLFNNSELKAWWMQASLLPPAMLHNPALKSIHRTPHNYIPPDWKRDGVCGWSLGTYLDGVVMLSDECLTLDPNHVLDTSNYFYSSTTHELGHRLSAWNFGKTFPNQPDLDQDPEFMKLSKWEILELVKDGKLVRQWHHGGDSMGWASEYAKSSPVEDFAESVGVFRTNPSVLSTRAPAKYEYIKNKVFSGKGYIDSDLKTQYVKEIAQRLAENVGDWSSTCFSTPPVGVTLSRDQQALAQKIVIDLPIVQSVKNCIAAQWVDKIASILSDLRYEEPEGCSILDTAESAIVQSALPISVPSVMAYLKSSSQIVEALDGIKNFRSAVAKEFDPKIIYFGCLAKESPKDCLLTGVGLEFDRLYQRYKPMLAQGSDLLITFEKNRFLSANAYEVIQTQVLDFYQQLFSAEVLKLPALANEIWSRCVSLRVSEVKGALSTTPYSAGAAYLAPSILACINEQSLIEMTGVRSRVAKSIRIDFFSPESKVWINTQILFPTLKASFDGLLQSARDAESVEVKQFAVTLIPKTIKLLSDDLNWNASGLSYQEPACFAEVTKRVQSQLSDRLYRFTAIETYQSDWVAQICKKVGDTLKERASHIPALKANMLDPYWDTFTQLALSEASSRFDRCRSRIYFSSVGKRYCLFNEMVIDDSDQYRKNAWRWTMDRSLNKWLKTRALNNWAKSKGYAPDAIKAVAEARAEAERQEISGQILDRFFR